jgi:hypothetical protein
LAPVKRNRYVPRTRKFTIPFASPEFESFMYCNEEISPFFDVPPLPRMEAYSYEISFVTGRALSLKIRAFRYYINDTRFFLGILNTINNPDDSTSNLTKFQRATLIMALLNGLACNEDKGGRSKSMDMICQYPLFWRLHQALGLDFFKTVQVKIVYPDYEEVRERVEIPLFEEDARRKKK